MSSSIKRARQCPCSVMIRINKMSVNQSTEVGSLGQEDGRGWLPLWEHQRIGRVSTDVWAPGMQVVKQGFQATNTGIGQQRVLLQTNKTPQKFTSGFATNEFWCQSRKKHLVFRIIWISEFQIWDCSPVDNQGMFVGFMSDPHTQQSTVLIPMIHLCSTYIQEAVSEKKISLVGPIKRFTDYRLCKNLTVYLSQ